MAATEGDGYVDGLQVLAPGDVQDIDNSDAFAFLADLAQNGSLTTAQYVRRCALDGCTGAHVAGHRVLVGSYRLLHPPRLVPPACDMCWQRVEDTGGS